MTRVSRFIVAAALAITFGAVSAASADGHCSINGFGGPRRFADGGASTEADLQMVFREHRGDIERLLQQAGWQGNTADLFGAIAAGEASEKDFPPGTPFEWMMLRYKGVAQMAVDKCWGGKESFPGWSLTVESNGRRWNFVIPKACGNLALMSSAALPPAVPERNVEAEAAAAAARTKAEAKTAEAAEKAKAEAEAADAAEKARTEAEAAEAAKAKAEAAAAAEAAAMAKEEARRNSLSKGSCLLRGFFGNSSASDDYSETENEGTVDETRTHAGIGSGSGFGVEGECLVTPIVGIAVGLMSFDQDGDIMYDDINVWEMDSDDIGWLALSAGANFHITKPESKFDLFIGPFLGYVSFDNASFSMMGETTRLNFDDEFTWGLQIGVGVPTRKGIGFYAGLRYFDLTAEVQGQDIEFELNPIVVAAGITYRFK
jgi:outer membrane protein W